MKKPSNRPEPKIKLSHGLVGHAGQYLVCAELSKRGWLASITLSNAEKIDILAHHSETNKSVAIQVKTSSGAEPKWILSEKNEVWSAPHVFYALVVLGKEPAEIHIVPSEIVRNYIFTKHRKWLAGRKKSGEPRKDSGMRKFEDLAGEFLNRWEFLLEERKAEQG